MNVVPPAIISPRFIVGGVLSQLIVNIVGDDGLTTKERHDKEYAQNIANEKEYMVQCYQGNKRACKIAIYSSEQIEKYRITYPTK